MNAIDRLLANYSRQVRLPWSTNVAGKQRVWFAVYPPAEERRVRARIGAFETSTLEAKHGWTEVDLTPLLPRYLAAHKYKEQIFKQPQHWKPAGDLEARATELIKTECSIEAADANCVVAITGLASMFDFMRVSSLVEHVEDSLKGRLLVFFPGEYTGNVYRFMDARDGFNYMAVPITSTESLINP
jgi:hypothetical protein